MTLIDRIRAATQAERLKLQKARAGRKTAQRPHNKIDKMTKASVRNG